MTVMAALSTELLCFVTFDVFTETAFAGNPLAIVMGADDLSSAQMQTIAREFNLSETIFVQRPDDPGNTAKVRIFFPTAEIPFAGHPTIGCAIHLAQEAHPEDDFDVEIRLEELAGLVPVRVQRRGADIHAELTAPVVPKPAVRGAVPDTALAAEAVGLKVSELGFAAHRIGLWEGGPRFLYLPVSGIGALACARPCEPAWSRMIEAAAVDCAYLYTPGQDCDFRARLFSPTAGIPEDPATGSASAILAAQLLASGALPDGESRFRLKQGVEMGRPSMIGLRCHVSGGSLQSVHIAGSARKVAEGQMIAPAG